MGHTKEQHFHNTMNDMEAQFAMVLECNNFLQTLEHFAINTFYKLLFDYDVNTLTHDKKTQYNSLSLKASCFIPHLILTAQYD